MVYHGPREDILPFFAQQGMHCPERKADSDFLQEVTSRKDQKVGHKGIQGIQMLGLVGKTGLQPVWGP